MSLKCSNCGSARLIYEQEGKPKRTRPRMGKHERLLRALLKVCDIDDSALDGKGLLYRGRRIMVSDRTEKQLIAIKQAMDKKGGKV